jgi:CRP-like cAMP-binding protein
VGRQTERPSPVDLNLLVESQTWEPGQIIMEKGEGNRDLLFLIKGHVEILTNPGEGDLVLNEVDAPHILGDIAFLSGLPRTATVMAKTEVKAFVLIYDRFRDLFGRFPEWLQPLLSSFTSGIKSLHYQIAELEKQVQALKKRLD